MSESKGLSVPELAILAIVAPLVLALAVFFLVIPMTSASPAQSPGGAPEGITVKTAAAKTSSPLAMRFVLTQTPAKPGDPGEFVLSVTPELDVEDLVIKVAVPEKLKAKGQLEWSGPVKKGETRILTASFTVPDSKHYELKATAWARSEKSANLRNVRVIEIGSAPEKTNAPKGQEKKDPSGKKIIEFEVPKTK